MIYTQNNNFNIGLAVSLGSGDVTVLGGGCDHLRGEGVTMLGGRV